jgi:broad specificity phosphatase PhoE
MKTIYLLRHEKCGGRGYTGSGSDVGLTSDGQEGAERTAEELTTAGLDIIFTSPMKRCIATAKPISRITGLEPVQNSDLAELNFGLWEGRTYDEIMEDSPLALTAWVKAPETGSPPGGESLSQMYRRVEDFWKTRIVDRGESSILIVSHGGPIRTMLSILSGGGIKAHWTFQIDRGNFCIIKLYDDGKCQITGTNLKQITE